MKKLFFIVLLAPAILFADDFIVLWLNVRASTHDKVAVRDGLYDLLNDHSKLSLADLPKWATTNAPCVTGWVCVINFDNPKSMTKANTNNLTIAKLNEWRDSYLSTPAHLQWRRGTNWMEIQRNEGMITVTNQ